MPHCLSPRMVYAIARPPPPAICRALRALGQQPAGWGVSPRVEGAALEPHYLFLEMAYAIARPPPPAIRRALRALGRLPEGWGVSLGGEDAALEPSFRSRRRSPHPIRVSDDGAGRMAGHPFGESERASRPCRIIRSPRWLTPSPALSPLPSAGACGRLGGCQRGVCGLLGGGGFFLGRDIFG